MLSHHNDESTKGREKVSIIKSEFQAHMGIAEFLRNSMSIKPFRFKLYAYI